MRFPGIRLVSFSWTLTFVASSLSWRKKTSDCISRALFLRKAPTKNNCYSDQNHSENSVSIDCENLERFEIFRHRNASNGLFFSGVSLTFRHPNVWTLIKPLFIFINFWYFPFGNFWQILIWQFLLGKRSWWNSSQDLPRLTLLFFTITS